MELRNELIFRRGELIFARKRDFCVCGVFRVVGVRYRVFGGCFRVLGGVFVLCGKAPAVENFAWLPVGVISAKPARGSVSLI